MDHREVASYNTFASIRDYGAANTDTFPVASFGGGLFTEMGQVVIRLEHLGANQVSSTGATHQSTGSKSAARSALKATLDAMNLTANAMAHDTPGLEDKFRRPRAKAAQALLNAAQAFLDDALPLKAEFIKYGMGADFLDELAGEISDFKQAASDRHTHGQAGVSTRADLEAAIEDGLRLRQKLDAVVRNTVRGNPALLAAWESASHIEQPSRKRRSSPPKPPTGAPPATDTPGGSEPSK
jgi:hypothetical protein